MNIFEDCDVEFKNGNKMNVACFRDVMVNLELINKRYYEDDLNAEIDNIRSNMLLELNDDSQQLYKDYCNEELAIAKAFKEKAWKLATKMRKSEATR